jgi:hypothetical protein
MLDFGARVRKQIPHALQRQVGAVRDGGDACVGGSDARVVVFLAMFSAAVGALIFPRQHIKSPDLEIE